MTYNTDDKNPIHTIKEVKHSNFEELDEQTKKTLLVLGGSLGARRINELVAANLPFFESQNISIIWQCGKLYYEAYKVYNDHEHIQVHAFLNQMDLAYAASDFIISRAGASSVSELCIVGKPVIFIPSPNVAEDHQSKNAKAVVDKHAALMIKESELETFPIVFETLLKDLGKQQSLSENINELALPNIVPIFVT